VTGTPVDPSEIEEPAPPTSNAPAEDLEPDNPMDNQSLALPARPSYMLQHHPSQLTLDDTALALGRNTHKRYPITATKVPGHPGAGMGRIVRFDKPVPLTDIIDRIGLGLGNPKGFPIAVPQGKQAGDMMIRSIGICAGSGGGAFSQMEKDGEDVDLYFTGELSHHEALAAIEKGKCVICLFHSNTERGFLHGVLKAQLEETIAEEWERVRKEELQADGVSEELKDSLEDEHFDVAVSEVDRDPYGIMIAKSEL
jgi:putative NIF3 family GTP cyclohydrolase 1 type 2